MFKQIQQADTLALITTGMQTQIIIKRHMSAGDPVVSENSLTNATVPRLLHLITFEKLPVENFLIPHMLFFC